MTTQRLDGRIPELDGLRGTAILLVLVYHYVTIGFQGDASRSSLRYYAERLVPLGWTGVDLFFVLSGFLIGGILLDVRNSPRYYRTFYGRRFFRIVPIYYAWISTYVLLVTFARGVILAHSNSGVIAKPNLYIFGHYLFLQNFMLPPFIGLSAAWFGPLWSLAVEEQFYLISPLVVRVFSTRYLKTLLILVIAGAPLLRITLLRVLHVNPWRLYALMPCRADSLAIGMLAAALWRAPGFRDTLSRSVALLYGALALFLGGIGILWKLSPNVTSWGMVSVGFTWLALFFALVLLLVISQPRGPLAWLARMSWLREFGRVSYCMYIIHGTVLLIVHALIRHTSPSIADWRATAVTVLAGLVTYCVAWLSAEYFEGPLQRRGHAFKY